MATPWTVPPMWAGRTVAILASGPSLLESLQVLAARHEKPPRRQASVVEAIALNTTFKSAPWAGMLYGADSSWWLYHAQDALKFEGFKVTCDVAVPFPAVRLLRNTGGHGFDTDPANVRTGANSAYQAAHLAIHAGAVRILLCGVDMTARHGSHHHGDHPQTLRNTPECAYQEMRRRWPALGKAAAERGIEIFNCSAMSALECFPRRRIEDLI